MDEGDDDTLTESCEGAINFMVIEMEVGSLQKLPFGDVVEVKFGAGWDAVRPKIWVCITDRGRFDFVFYEWISRQTPTSRPL